MYPSDSFLHDNPGDVNLKGIQLLLPVGMFMLTHATMSAPGVMTAALESLCFISPARSSVHLCNLHALAPFSLRRRGYLFNKRCCLLAVGDVALQLCSFPVCLISRLVVLGQALLNAVWWSTAQRFTSLYCFSAWSATKWTSADRHLAATPLAAVLSKAVACTVGLTRGFLLRVWSLSFVLFVQPLTTLYWKGCLLLLCFHTPTSL